MDAELVREEACFPRCEYRWRYKGTSAFQMDDLWGTVGEFWGTYFRSTRDRQAIRYRDYKRYINYVTTRDEKGHHATLAGSIRSPFTFDYYNFHLGAGEKLNLIPHGNNTPLPYDTLLNYKLKVCDTIVTKLQGQGQVNSGITAAVFNNYPCVLIWIPELAAESHVQENWIVLAMSYFVAFANNNAKRNGIPVELLQRSSFGHNQPSIAEMKTCFRLNIGLVPDKYTDVIVTSLHDLGKFLASLKMRNNPEALKVSQCDYDELVLAVQSSQVLLDAQRSKLLKACNKGKYFRVLIDKFLKHIVTTMKHREWLCDLVATELDKSAPCLQEPLLKLITHYISPNQAVPVVLDMGSPKDWGRPEDPAVGQDQTFWKVVSLVFTSLQSTDSNCTLAGLYASLERANLKFIQSCNDSKDEGDQGVDYGSSSDYEEEEDDTQDGPVNTLLCSRKLIVATGMRAINITHTLALMAAQKKGLNLTVDSTFMYYETAAAVKYAINLQSSLGNNTLNVTNKDAKLVYLDITHCAVDGLKEVKLDKFDNIDSATTIVVLDYTSAQTCHIKEYVEYFRHKCFVLFLVSSGLKNEQFGADLNPYGTIRIVSKDGWEVVNHLYEAALKLLKTYKEKLPIKCHKIRRAYKAIGALPSSLNMFSYPVKSNAQRTAADILGTPYGTLLQQRGPAGLRADAAAMLPPSVAAPSLSSALDVAMEYAGRDNMQENCGRHWPNRCPELTVDAPGKLAKTF